MMELFAPNYNPKIRRMLTELIKEHQESQLKPYIVTDWDNTAIIFDSQQSLFIYQIENLHYRLTPERFRQILAMDLSAEQRAAVADLLTAIGRAYQSIYQNYIGFGGKQSLAEIREKPYFKEFLQGMACLYKQPFGHYVECCRILYLFENYSLSEVAELTELSIRDNLGMSPQTVHYQFQSGTQTWQGSFQLGLRFVPEQEEFFRLCREKGIKVYVISASHKTVVEVHAARYGIPKDQVYALELCCDDRGIIEAKIDLNKPQTVKEGKAKTIADQIWPKHQSRPLLIMGDSMGDFAMMRDFADKIVIVQTKNAEKLRQALIQEKMGDFEIYLQARNDEKGSWSFEEKESQH